MRKIGGMRKATEEEKKKGRTRQAEKS